MIHLIKKCNRLIALIFINIFNSAWLLKVLYNTCHIHPFTQMHLMAMPLGVLHFDTMTAGSRSKPPILCSEDDRLSLSHGCHMKGAPNVSLPLPSLSSATKTIHIQDQDRSIGFIEDLSRTFIFLLFQKETDYSFSSWWRLLSLFES